MLGQPWPPLTFLTPSPPANPGKFSSAECSRAPRVLSPDACSLLIQPNKPCVSPSLQLPFHPNNRRLPESSILRTGNPVVYTFAISRRGGLMILDQPAAVQGLQSLTHWILIIILPLIGIAALTMALIQTAKNMLPLRQWFQRNSVNSWLAVRAHTARSATPAIDVEQAKTDLVHLTTAGDSAALYSLPIEQLCGQINAATQIILDYPAHHWDLLRCLASQSN